jgi:hypothetical protein
LVAPGTSPASDGDDTLTGNGGADTFILGAAYGADLAANDFLFAA